MTSRTRPVSIHNGVLPIDKPAGMTSHDVVARVRKLAATRRVGHAGTLDPDATGVLLVCVGHATRVAEYLADEGKEYRCRISLGTATTTEDASGDVVEEQDASHITREQFESVLPQFLGEIMQVPPMVSAVHHEGKRLYELARAGVIVDRPARPVTISALTLDTFHPVASDSFVAFAGDANCGRPGRGDSPSAEFTVRCGKGTYIRTLCVDIGRALGVPAHMHSLRRTAVGGIRVENCVPLNDITPELVGSILVRPSRALGDIPKITVSAADIENLGHGRAIRCGVDDAPLVAAISDAEELIALGRVENGILSPTKVFPPANQSNDATAVS